MGEREDICHIIDIDGNNTAQSIMMAHLIESVKPIRTTVAQSAVVGVRAPQNAEDRDILFYAAYMSDRLCVKCIAQRALS